MSRRADSRALESLDYRTKTLDKEAGHVSGWLHEMRGLVEPEQG